MEAYDTAVEQPSMQPYCIEQHFTELVLFALTADAGDMCQVSNFVKHTQTSVAWH